MWRRCERCTGAWGSESLGASTMHCYDKWSDAALIHCLYCWMTQLESKRLLRFIGLTKYGANQCQQLRKLSPRGLKRRRQGMIHVDSTSQLQVKINASLQPQPQATKKKYGQRTITSSNVVKLRNLIGAWQNIGLRSWRCITKHSVVRRVSFDSKRWTGPSWAMIPVALERLKLMSLSRRNAIINRVDA